MKSRFIPQDQELDEYDMKAGTYIIVNSKIYKWLKENGVPYPFTGMTIIEAVDFNEEEG